MIVGLKIKLILLGVAAQSMQEFEDYARQPERELNPKDSQQWTRTELNLGYLFELVEPKLLQLQVFEPLEKPLTFKSVMEAYRLTALKLRTLENYIAPTYNAEIKLSKKGVQWNSVEGKWAVVIEDLED